MKNKAASAPASAAVAILRHQESEAVAGVVIVCSVTNQAEQGVQDGRVETHAPLN